MFVILVLLPLIGLSQGCTEPTIANSTILAANGTYSVKCDEGFALQGAATLSCKNGTLIEALPTCLRGACSEPTIVKGSASLKDGKWSVGCDAGYKINGTAELICSRKTLQFSILPTCIDEVVSKNCSVPVVPKGEIFPNVPIANAVYKLTCNQGYKLIGSKYLTCANGSIRETIPTCVPDPFNCEPGSYFRRGSCVLCPPNTFSEIRSVGCTRCPGGQVSSAGSKTVSDCRIEVKVAGPPPPKKDDNKVDSGPGRGGDSGCDGAQSSSSIHCQYFNRIHASDNIDNTVEADKAVGSSSEQSFDKVVIIMIAVIVVIVIVIACVVVKFIILRQKPVYSPVTEREEGVQLQVEETIELIGV